MKLFAVLVLTAGSLLQAADLQAGTIIFTPPAPTSSGAGIVNGNGTYTLACGETLVSVTLYAILPCGGKARSFACGTSMMGATKFWTGSMTGLPAGTYTVYAVLTVTSGAGTLTFSTGDSSLVVS